MTSPCNEDSPSNPSTPILDLETATSRVLAVISQLHQASNTMQGITKLWPQDPTLDSMKMDVISNVKNAIHSCRVTLESIEFGLSIELALPKLRQWMLSQKSENDTAPKTTEPSLKNTERN